MLRISKALAKKLGITTKGWPSKYRAVRTVADGVTFDSKREAARYGELKALLAAGQIVGLRLQPEFELTVKNTVIGRYVADFEYWCDGQHIIEDVKGVRTPLYKWKRRHLAAEHGIVILETR